MKFWASNKQVIYWNWFFGFWRLRLRSRILKVWCDVVTHYKNANNVFCTAVNAQRFERIEHITVYIGTLLHTRNPYSYSHFKIFVCIYSARGEIDQISTNVSTYTTCSAANVYIFVYILIGTHIVPLTCLRTYCCSFVKACKTRKIVNPRRFGNFNNIPSLLCTLPFCVIHYPLSRFEYLNACLCCYVSFIFPWLLH